MTWAVFAIAAWLLMGAELGVRHALALGPSWVAPSFVVPLLVFVAMFAQPARQNRIQARRIGAPGSDRSYITPPDAGTASVHVGIGARASRVPSEVKSPLVPRL